MASTSTTSATDSKKAEAQASLTNAAAGCAFIGMGIWIILSLFTDQVLFAAVGSIAIAVGIGILGQTFVRILQPN